VKTTEGGCIDPRGVRKTSRRGMRIAMPAPRGRRAEVSA
jgi:hypothetical protein